MFVFNSRVYNLLAVSFAAKITESHSYKYLNWFVYQILLIKAY